MTDKQTIKKSSLKHKPKQAKLLTKRNKKRKKKKANTQETLPTHHTWAERKQKKGKQNNTKYN